MNCSCHYLLNYYYYYYHIGSEMMQWMLGAARCIQALIFLFRHRLDASRHFLASFSVISDHVLQLNFADFLGGKGFALAPKKGLQTPSKPFLFLSRGVQHQCIQQRRAQALFNLPLHHCTWVKYVMRQLIWKSNALYLNNYFKSQLLCQFSTTQFN